jgi:hypothetical protein
VGKKPPQSQKGGSHGLTPRDVRGAKPEGGKNTKNKKIKKFGFPPRHKRPGGAPRGRLGLAKE